jgi:serine protease
LAEPDAGDAAARPDGLRTRDLGALAERLVRPEQLRVEDRSVQRTLEAVAGDLTPDKLAEARDTAQDIAQAGEQAAQRVGDEVIQKAQEQIAPRALMVRQKLREEVAVTARSRAFEKLEEMGLSGIVTPGEGGAMRITLDVDPTQFAPRPLDPDKLDGVVRNLFARAKRSPEMECQGNPSRQRLREDAVLATECVVQVLRESGEYEYVEKDYVFSHQFAPRPRQDKPAAAVRRTPNDPLWSLQWHFMDNGDGVGQSPGGAGFGDFWTRAKITGSRSVTVAVVDTGLQMAHPDIAGSPNIAPGFDMVSDPVMGNDGDGRDPDPNDPGDKCDPSDPLARDTFHGTHVAGTVGAAATNNAAGVAAGAWDVTIVPVRALGRCGGKLSDINDAIRWAAGTVPARDALGEEIWNANPADIINLSIGLFEPCPASMQEAINDAVKAGAIVVAAAGNARIDTQYYAPGGCNNVITVAASDARGQLTPYSNFGESVDILAPGGDMTRDDNGDGRPDGVLSTKFSTDCYDPVTGDDVAQCSYAFENGTSMAAPHVSAALALIKAKFPAALPSELRTRLLAASSARSAVQCAGRCANYPGSEPIPGQEDLCFRPCGGALLNLGQAAVQ